jgi:hypothetical protein
MRQVAQFSWDRASDLVPGEIDHTQREARANGRRDGLADAVVAMSKLPNQLSPLTLSETSPDSSLHDTSTTSRLVTPLWNAYNTCPPRR